MYSYEIDNLLKLRDYIISSSEYFEILNTSPQINNIKYDTSNDTTMIRTDDNYEVKFKVKRAR